MPISPASVSCYVDRGGEQVIRPPIMATGVQSSSFILEGDMAALQGLCDRYFNQPAQGALDIRPAIHYVVLNFNVFRKQYSTDPQARQMGWLPEQEAVLWVLTLDARRQRLLWFVPYIFVDSGYAMAAGREIYGFPKALGWFQIPAEPQHATLWSADTMVFAQFTPETEGTRQRLIDIRRTTAAPDTGLLKTWESVVGMSQEIVRTLLHDDAGELLDFRLALHLLEDLMHGRVPMIFLKQFRDAVHSTQASYQAVIEASAMLERFHRGGLLHGNFEITIHPYQSHPIHEDLGLPAGILRPLLSYWVEFDFSIANGTELWKASC